MTNRERLVLHPGSGSSSRVRRVRARRCICFSLGAPGRAVLAVLLAAATPASFLHGSEGRGAPRPCTSESNYKPGAPDAQGYFDGIHMQAPLVAARAATR